jgi:hypothetical protein
MDNQLVNHKHTHTHTQKDLLPKDKANQVGFVRQWNILLLKQRQIFLTTWESWQWL